MIVDVHLTAAQRRTISISIGMYVSPSSTWPDSQLAAERSSSVP